MKLQKVQIFLKTNKPCVRKGNKTCDETQVYEESEAREKKGMNENKVENSGEKISSISIETNKKTVENYGKKIMDTNLEDVQMKDCESGICPVCKNKVDKNIVKNINYEQCSVILYDPCFRTNILAFGNLKK